MKGTDTTTHHSASGRSFGGFRTTSGNRGPKPSPHPPGDAFPFPPDPLCCAACGRESAANGVERSFVRANVRALKRETHPVWRCPSCSSILAAGPFDPVSAYAYYPMRRDARAGLLPGHVTRFGRTMMIDRWRLLRRLGLQPRQKVLDFGCLDGDFVAFLRAQGVNASGYEPHGQQFSDESVLAESRDWIVSQDVIEHLADPCAHLAWASRALLPGGHLVIATPDAARIDLAQPDAMIMDLHQPFHRVIFSARALQVACASRGLELLAIWRGFAGDRVFPFHNLRAALAYARVRGGWLDALYEPLMPSPAMVSARLWRDGIFGGLVPFDRHMTLVFRRPRD